MSQKAINIASSKSKRRKAKPIPVDVDDDDAPLENLDINNPLDDIPIETNPENLNTDILIGGIRDIQSVKLGRTNLNMLSFLTTDKLYYLTKILDAQQLYLDNP